MPVTGGFRGAQRGGVGVLGEKRISYVFSSVVRSRYE